MRQALAQIIAFHASLSCCRCSCLLFGCLAGGAGGSEGGAGGSDIRGGSEAPEASKETRSRVQLAPKTKVSRLPPVGYENHAQVTSLANFHIPTASPSEPDYSELVDTHVDDVTC